MRILKGSPVRKALENQHVALINQLKNQSNHLAIITNNNSFSTTVFTKVKQKYLKQFNIFTTIFNFAPDCSESKITNLILKLNNDDSFQGILVQLPLLNNLKAAALCDLVIPCKDVDSLNRAHLGNLMKTRVDLTTDVVPGVVFAVLSLLDYYKISVHSRLVTIINNNFLIGLPLTACLSLQGASVITLNKCTPNLDEFISKTDILITATGVKNLINNSNVHSDLVVIDLGITHDENNNVVGDVDYQPVLAKCQAVTPVPGGIGPLTLFGLLYNFIKLRNNNYKNC